MSKNVSSTTSCLKNAFQLVPPEEITMDANTGDVFEAIHWQAPDDSVLLARKLPRTLKETGYAASMAEPPPLAMLASP